jgi:hypothetical protein
MQKVTLKKSDNDFVIEFFAINPIVKTNGYVEKQKFSKPHAICLGLTTKNSIYVDLDDIEIENEIEYQIQSSISARGWTSDGQFIGTKDEVNEYLSSLISDEKFKKEPYTGEVQLILSLKIENWLNNYLYFNTKNVDKDTLINTFWWLIKNNRQTLPNEFVSIKNKKVTVEGKEVFVDGSK